MFINQHFTPHNWLLIKFFFNSASVNVILISIFSSFRHKKSAVQESSRRSGRNMRTKGKCLDISSKNISLALYSSSGVELCFDLLETSECVDTFQWPVFVRPSLAKTVLPNSENREFQEQIIIAFLQKNNRSSKKEKKYGVWGALSATRVQMQTPQDFRGFLLLPVGSPKWHWNIETRPLGYAEAFIFFHRTCTQLFFQPKSTFPVRKVEIVQHAN